MTKHIIIKGDSFRHKVDFNFKVINIRLPLLICLRNMFPVSKYMARLSNKDIRSSLRFQASIHLFKVYNTETRTIDKICSKLCPPRVFIVICYLIPIPQPVYKRRDRHYEIINIKNVCLLLLHCYTLSWMMILLLR